jgi:membrane AbrB-like protein
MITLVTSVFGGLVFKLLHIPIPWMLGAMIAVLIGSNVWKGYYEWPGQIRNAGMIIVGYTIGLSMTAAALREMGRQLPMMLLMAILLMTVCSGIAWSVSRLSDTDFKTALLGSVPGGLNQILILAEETDGVDITVVTVTQVIRLMMIVLCIPLLIFSPIFHQTHGTAAMVGSAATAPAATAVTAGSVAWNGSLWTLCVFALVSVACAWAGGKIKLPTAFLLGPVIGTAALQMGGLPGPALPAVMTDAAQLMVGAYVGLLLKPQQLPNKLRTLSLAIGSGLLLVLGALGLAALLSLLQPITKPTALLSLAPGGMDQMGIIANEIHADLSMVAGYQLFRNFFILFAVPPLIRMLFKIKPGRVMKQGMRSR